MDLAIELKKAVEHEGDNNTNCSRCPWNVPQRPGKEISETGDQRKIQDHPDHNTVKIS